MNEQIVITNSAEETKTLGVSVAKNLHGHNVIALHGELGSGKTTFVQGLAKELGMKKRITSPTFIIVRRYKMNIKYKISNIKYFYHVDLYRINCEEEIKGLGIAEIIEDQTNVVVMEWAEKMGEMLPKRRIDIHFEYIDEDKRKIIINGR